MSLVRNSCAAAVAAILLVACGSGDDEGLSGPKARLAAEADPICAETREKVGDLGGDPAAERDAVQSAADRLRALPIPNEDEADYIVFYTHVGNLAMSLDDLAQSRLVDNPDPGRVSSALDRARQSNEEVKKAAADYGLVECSQGLAT